MTALNSLPLWGTLAALGVALPVLIHLLNKARPKKIPWAAMELLRRTSQQRARRVKHEDLLLMLLRCLALFFAALAMMRLILPGLGGGFAEASREVVVGVDTSYSMKHGQFDSRFALAIRQVRQVLGDLPTGSKVSLVAMGTQPDVVLRHADPNPDLIDKRLESMKPTDGLMSLDANLAMLAELAAESDLPNRSVVIVTDGQRTDWANLSEPSKAILTRMSEASPTTVLAVSDGTSENMSIADLRVVSAVRREGGRASLAATVTNHGESPASTTATLTLDGVEADVVPVGPLEPGQRQVVRFGVGLEQVGQNRLEASIASDNLETDNRCYALIDVRDALSVLIVEGRPNAAPRDRAAYYLELASRLVRSGYATGMQTSVVPGFSLTPTEVNAADVVVLADVGVLSGDVVELINQRVAEGMGLMIYAGEGVDAALSAGSLGPLLPVELIERVEPDAGVTANPVVTSSGHPLAGELSRLSDDLGDVLVRGFQRVRPLPDAQTLLQLSSGEPLLVVRQVGRGRVAFLATGPGRAWTTLPVTATGPILFHLLLDEVSSGEESQPVEVGDLIELSVANRDMGTELKTTMPNGETGAPERLDSDADDDRTRLSLGVADSAGFYELFLRQDLEPRQVASNVNAGEGAIAVLPTEALESALDEVGVRVSAEREGSDGRRADVSLWRWFALLALLLMVTQSALSAWFTRRKRASGPAIRTGYGVGVTH